LLFQVGKRWRGVGKRRCTGAIERCTHRDSFRQKQSVCYFQSVITPRKTSRHLLLGEPEVATRLVEGKWQSCRPTVGNWNKNPTPPPPPGAPPRGGWLTVLCSISRACSVHRWWCGQKLSNVPAMKLPDSQLLNPPTVVHRWDRLNWQDLEKRADRGRQRAVLQRPFSRFWADETVWRPSNNV